MQTTFGRNSGNSCVRLCLITKVNFTCYAVFAVAFSVLFFRLSDLNGQSSSSHSDTPNTLPNGLFSRVWQGDPYTFRDIGTYLDDPILGDQAWSALQQVSLFKETEFDWRWRPTRQAFMDFFYKNKKNIFFDPSLGRFMLSPIETHELGDFFLRAIPNTPLPLAERANFFLIKAENAQTVQEYRNALLPLARLHQENAWKILVQHAEMVRKSDFSFNPFPSLVEALRYCPLQKSLVLTHSWLENDYISPQDLEIPLSEMLNQYIPVVEKGFMLALMDKYLSSATEMGTIREEGLHQISGLRPDFFDNPVHYYGILASKADAQPWAKKYALEKLIQSQDPLSLYYLSTEAWRLRHLVPMYRNPREPLAHILDPIDELTNFRVAVPDSLGATVMDGYDMVWLLNLTKYWAIHYKDYQWDSHQGKYINQLKSETVRDAAQVFFQRLSSRNDTVAQEAFRILTTFEPSVITPIAEELRSFNTAIHPSLPNFRLPFLEQMCKLVQACQVFGENWMPKPALDQKLRLLTSNLTENERLRLENELIDSISFGDLSALEYAALFYEQQSDFSLSCSRILDGAYARLWPDLIAEEQSLRFFLKKASLFAQIGTVGTCNRYLRRFEGEKLALQRVENLTARETDPDIQLAIQQLVRPVVQKTPRQSSSIPELSQVEFRALLAAIREKNEVTSQEMEQLMHSGLFDAEKHLTAVLENLAKLPDDQDGVYLDFPILLQPEFHLMYFENLPLNQRGLGQLSRIFAAESASSPTFIAFLEKKTGTNTSIERGQILIQAFSGHQWIDFILQLSDGQLEWNWVQTSLETYLNESEYMSEFEESELRFLLLLLQKRGQSLEKKLEEAIRQGAPYRVQQQLLAYAEWDDLAKIGPYLPLLQASPSGMPGHHFLNRDFGLPPLNFSETNTFSRYFSTSETQKTASEVYRDCLVEFGLLDGQADELPQLYQLLRRELITPFAGGGGILRDWGVFAAVKVLEARYGETFGFHEKLNENQTFFTYNSRKRAERWLEFLDKNRLILETDRVQSWQ